MPIQKLPPCCRRTTVGGHEQLVIETAAGQRITLTDGTASVVIEDTNGNSIRMENGKVTVSTLAKLLVQAALIEIESAQVVVNAGMVQCSGVLQADTVIANTVTAATYSPGAGNVW
jgi:hypothetical protein